MVINRTNLENCIWKHGSILQLKYNQAIRNMGLYVLSQPNSFPLLRIPQKLLLPGPKDGLTNRVPLLRSLTRTDQRSASSKTSTKPLRPCTQLESEIEMGTKTKEIAKRSSKYLEEALYKRLFRSGISPQSVRSELETFLKSRKRVFKWEVGVTVRKLRDHKRFKTALKVNFFSLNLIPVLCSLTPSLPDRSCSGLGLQPAV